MLLPQNARFFSNLLDYTAIAAVRDLDDTSLHTWQQELGLRRSEITIDGKNFDNERCHDQHINRNEITVRKVSWIRQTGDFVPLADGWCSDSDNEIDFRFTFAGAPSRGGGIEQCSISQPRDDKVHRHKRWFSLVVGVVEGGKPAAAVLFRLRSWSHYKY